MRDKQINTCEFLNICQTNGSGTLEDTEVCHCYELYKQLKAENEKFEQTITEIKDFLEYEFYGKNVWVKEKILQKISEVENA